jgi:uncharacterized protein Yka (UPF0111/DUF47 family)
METGDSAVGQCIRQDEHEADRVKIHNLHTLNEAFSTPIDREDLYRAIIDLDEIVNYCKTTVSEMEVLGLAPTSTAWKWPCTSSSAPMRWPRATPDLPRNRPRRRRCRHRAQGRAPRRKNYRRAIAELFVGDDYIHMFKRREIYRHLSNAADRMANCANTLHDIVVKMC